MVEEESMETCGDLRELGFESSYAALLIERSFSFQCC